MKAFFTALTRHPLSLAGTAITTSMAILFLTLFSLDLMGMQAHPYFGILAYVVVPAIFVLGLVLIPIGLHRARRQPSAGIEPFPILDFNHPEVRNRFLIFLSLTVINIVIVAVATYKAVEVMDTVTFCGKACHSVMAPEYTSYQRGAHASVACVDCHIGPKAGWFVKSKLSGSWQLISVNLDLYPRPIPTPVHNLRPARETCEQCHWPQKFVGDRLKVITKYADDERNTELKTVLLMRVGGRSGTKSRGIHWHVDPSNTIRYRSDPSRETIYEVELTDRKTGKVEHWYAPEAEKGKDAGQGSWRVMDCVDCHNRPAHTYHTAEYEVDSAIETGLVAKDLPFVHREGLKLVKAGYSTREVAHTAIVEGLKGFYAKSYPQIAADRGKEIEAAAEALWKGWSSNVFPSMNVTWGTYPNHIGHTESPGCWRCHDDAHATKDGHTIPQDCDTCHSLLAEDEANPKVLETLSP